MIVLIGLRIYAQIHQIYTHALNYPIDSIEKMAVKKVQKG